MSELKLVKTCGACPEQYDVFHEGQQVGYLRLRHGYFYAEYPGCGGRRVYESETIGDGIFDEDERPRHIGLALHCIRLSMDSSHTAMEYVTHWESTITAGKRATP